MAPLTRKWALLHSRWRTFSLAWDQIWIASALYIGPQFRSEEFAHFMKVNGVKHVRVAPHHAAGNGLAERMVQSWTTWRPAKVVNCRFSNVLPTTCRLTGQQGMLPLTEHQLAYSWDESTHPFNRSSSKCLGKGDGFTSKAESDTWRSH